MPNLQSFAFAFSPTSDFVWSGNLTDNQPPIVQLPLDVLSSDGGAVTEQWSLLPGEQVQCFYSAPLTAASEIEAATATLYQRLLDQVPTSEIYRIWNFIPDINAGAQNLDNYMRFCKGRADVFDARGYAKDVFSAASALGYLSFGGTLAGERVIAVVLSGPGKIYPLENPRQTPAYRYPRVYGPQPPSFARAVVVDHARLLVSGTASILQSETQHVGDVVAQTQLAAENVATLLSCAETQHGFKRGANHEQLRVYLRDPQHWVAAAQVLRQYFDLEAVNAVVLEAQICRPELLVELEFASCRRD